MMSVQETWLAAISSGRLLGHLADDADPQAERLEHGLVPQAAGRWSRENQPVFMAMTCSRTRNGVTRADQKQRHRDAQSAIMSGNVSRLAPALAKIAAHDKRVGAARRLRLHNSWRACRPDETPDGGRDAAPAVLVSSTSRNSASARSAWSWRSTASINLQPSPWRRWRAQPRRSESPPRRRLAAPAQNRLALLSRLPDLARGKAEHMAVFDQRGEFLLAPGPDEIFAMQNAPDRRHGRGSSGSSA